MDISIITIGVTSLLYEVLPVALEVENNNHIHKEILILSLIMIFGSILIDIE